MEISEDAGDGGDLAAFLADRYDEAEARARAAIKALPPYALKPLRDRAGDKLPEALAAHIDLSDPVHRLADIALKRAILAEYEAAVATMDRQIKERLPGPIAGDVYLVADPAVLAEVGALSLVVRQLGTEFADHPAYKESWKP